MGESLEPFNRLIAAISAAGPFTVRRALELAERVLNDNEKADALVVGDELTNTTKRSK